MWEDQKVKVFQKKNNCYRATLAKVSFFLFIYLNFKVNQTYQVTSF